MQCALALDSKLYVVEIIFCVNDPCSSSHDKAMRTGPAVIVQCGNFVIAGGCGPLENPIRCGFANELLAGEPENFTHVGIGFGA